MILCSATPYTRADAVAAAAAAKVPSVAVPCPAGSHWHVVPKHEAKQGKRKGGKR